jgi:hypothetical protein
MASLNLGLTRFSWLLSAHPKRHHLIPHLGHDLFLACPPKHVIHYVILSCDVACVDILMSPLNELKFNFLQQEQFVPKQDLALWLFAPEFIGLKLQLPKCNINDARFMGLGTSAAR